MTELSVRVIDCWVFRRIEKDIEFLIMRRSTGRLYDGIWHGVHGKIRSGEKAWEAALRELWEETGFRPRRMWVADGISQFYEAATDTMNLVPVFAVEVEAGQAPRLSREHNEWAWLDLRSAQERVAWKNHEESLERIWRMTVPESEHLKWLEIEIEHI